MMQGGVERASSEASSLSLLIVALQPSLQECKQAEAVPVQSLWDFYITTQAVGNVLHAAFNTVHSHIVAFI